MTSARFDPSGSSASVVAVGRSADGTSFPSRIFLQADELWIPGNADKALTGFDLGRGTGTVSGGSGEFTVSHGLGVTPSIILVTQGQPGGGHSVHVSDRSSTTFTIKCRDRSTNTWSSNGTEVYIYWLALKTSASLP